MLGTRRQGDTHSPSCQTISILAEIAHIMTRAAFRGHMFTPFAEAQDVLPAPILGRVVTAHSGSEGSPHTLV